MSSSPFNKPLVLTTKATLQQALLIIIPHFLVIIMTLSISHFTVLVRISIILVVHVSLAYFISLHLLKLFNKSIHSIRQDSARNWSILIANSSNQDYKSVTLLNSSFYSELLIILNFYEKSSKLFDSKRYTVVFTPDSLSSDEFRRLRVRLKTDKSLYK